MATMMSRDKYASIQALTGETRTMLTEADLARMRDISQPEEVRAETRSANREPDLSSRVEGGGGADAGAAQCPTPTRAPHPPRALP